MFNKILKWALGIIALIIIVTGILFTILTFNQLIAADGVDGLEILFHQFNILLGIITIGTGLVMLTILTVTLQNKN